MQALEAALERGAKTPLEIVWLQVAAEARMWDLRGLARTAQECGDQARPRPGCTVLGRTAWRYVFGGASPFPPESPSVARILVSALNLPRAPAEAGRFSVQGEGRLYVLMPASERATPSSVPPASIVLAAGSVLTATDALHPGIAIELRAPANEPLVIGSLQDTDLHRLVALLIRAPLGADAAMASPDGVVAFRSSTASPANSVAAALNGSSAEENTPVLQLAGTPGVAEALETGERLAAVAEPQLPVELASVVAAFELPLPAAPRELVLAGTEAIVAALEAGQPLPADPAPTGDFATLLAALEMPIPAREADLALSGTESIVAALEAGQRSLPERPDFPTELAAVVAAFEMPQRAPMPREIVVVVASAPATVAPAPAVGRTADIERLRAEVEAEVRREQERLAQRQGSGAGRRFQLGV